MNEEELAQNNLNIQQTKYNLRKAEIEKEYNLLSIQSNLSIIGKDNVASSQANYKLLKAKNTSLMTEEELSQHILDTANARYVLQKAIIDKEYNLLTIAENLSVIGKDGVAQAQMSYRLALLKNIELMTEEELSQNSLNIANAKYNLDKAIIDKAYKLLMIQSNLSILWLYSRPIWLVLFP